MNTRGQVFLLSFKFTFIHFCLCTGTHLTWTCGGQRTPWGIIHLLYTRWILGSNSGCQACQWAPLSAESSQCQGHGFLHHTDSIPFGYIVRRGTTGLHGSSALSFWRMLLFSIMSMLICIPINSLFMVPHHHLHSWHPAFTVSAASLIHVMSCSGIWAEEKANVWGNSSQTEEEKTNWTRGIYLEKNLSGKTPLLKYIKNSWNLTTRRSDFKDWSKTWKHTSHQ